MARIVIAEFMDDAAVAQLVAKHDVLNDPTLVDDLPRLIREAAHADAIVVRNRTQVRGELLAALGRCKVVGRLGVGLDNIDVVACGERRIVVAAATGANAQSVAEYVICAAMLLLRGAYRDTEAVAAGRWPRAELSKGREACGRTLGVVGFGSIGRTTAKLGRGVGMRVIGHDALLDDDDAAWLAADVEPASLDAVTRDSDVVSIHVPLVEATRGLFDAARIATMKPGAVLVNTSRGGIVDEAAVAAALRDGVLGGAALDVFESEPLAAPNPFADCPNLLLTPHIAGISAESNARVSAAIAARLLDEL